MAPGLRHPPGPLVGSLRRNLARWRKRRAPGPVLEWTKAGLPIPWGPQGPPPPRRRYNRPMDAAASTAFVDEETGRRRQVQEGAIRQARDQAARVVSPLGVVPNKPSKLRLILELRPLQLVVRRGAQAPPGGPVHAGAHGEAG